MNNHTKNWKDKQQKFRKEHLGQLEDDLNNAVDQSKSG
jgi:hypothetical protein